MDQLAGTIPLIPNNGFRVGGTIPVVEAATPRRVEDGLHRRGREADFVGDVIGTPPALLPHVHHPPAHGPTSPVRRVVRPRRPIEETGISFCDEPVSPLPDSLRIDLELLGRRFDRPTVVEDTSDHSSPSLGCQRCVRMLMASIVGHEPSWRDVSG